MRCLCVAGEPLLGTDAHFAHVRCSTANTDPMVFGGPGNSPKFARTFAPDQRSVEELEKILSWNGVHHKVVKMRD